LPHSRGWQRQTLKHILLFCPDDGDRREALITDVKKEDYERMTTTATGLVAVTKCFLWTGILGQFSIAIEMQKEDANRVCESLRDAGTCKNRGRTREGNTLSL
jgi:hypothetical protein